MDFLLKFTDFLVLFLACIGIVVASIYIFFYCKVKEIHKSPGDIYLGMCCGELVFVVHAAIFSIINLEQLYDYDPSFNIGLCYTNLITFTFAVSLIYAYTIQQYLFMIFKLLYSLQTQKLKNWVSHALTWIFALLFSGTSILTYDLYGCGKGSVTEKAPYTFIILLFSFYAMAITTRLYIQQQLAQFTQDGELKEEKQTILQAFHDLHGKDFQGYISRLFIGQAVLMTSFIVFSMVVFLLKENAAKSQKKNDFALAISIFTCLGEVSAVLYPVLIPILRLSDPFLVKHLKEYYYNLPGETPPVVEQELGVMRSSSFEENMNQFLIKKGEIPAIVQVPVEQNIETNIDIPEPGQTHSELENPFIEEFQFKRRSEIIEKMIALILLSERAKFDEEVQQLVTPRNFTSDFTKVQEFKIEQHQLKKYFPNLIGSKQKNPLTMSQYAPDVFQILIKHDLDKLNILDCLDMMRNARELKKCAQGKGGKSGEFFFFNYNNRLLLKSATPEELETLKKMLESYFWHCAEFPNTLIAKIIGIYTFEGFDIGRTTLIMMKNIAKINKLAFLRTYDLKGSTYDRQVCKKFEDYLEEATQNEKRRIKQKYNDTLKDKDFPNIDYELNVSEEDKEKIIEQLSVDTLYLKSQGFMDYSLCIIVVDWLSFLRTQQPNLREELLKDFMIEQINLRQHCYQNLKQVGQYYHLGIIDYLQTYNLQKFTEKYAKKVMKLNLYLDTSSQAPLEYMERFIYYQNCILGRNQYRDNLKPMIEIEEIRRNDQ